MAAAKRFLEQQHNKQVVLLLGGCFRCHQRTIVLLPHYGARQARPAATAADMCTVYVCWLAENSKA
jgi:hypothetical protein